MPLGDQDQNWAPHKTCNNCYNTLRGWTRGEKKSMKFAVPMVWRIPSNHLDDCYFCVVKVQGHSKKSGKNIIYPNLPSAIRPIPHSESLPVPVFKSFVDLDEDSASSASSSLTCPGSPSKPVDQDHGEVEPFNQADSNDLVLDLGLSKEGAELLAARLKERCMLAPKTKITRKRICKILQCRCIKAIFKFYCIL